MEKNEYCIIVNRKELYDVALGKDFQDVMLIDDSLSEDDINSMKSTAKSYALFYFDESGNTNGDRITKAIRDAGINCRYWEGFSWWDWDADTEVNSIEEAVRQFPDKKEVEDALISLGYINDTDYTDRCGNCTEYMRPGDKYCRHCGTRRGEGRFLPFYNQSTVLYGAPMVKMKYRCDNCGHLWVTGVLGGDNSLYCPMCGCDRLTLQEKDDRSMLEEFIGTEEPYDVNEGLQLFTEEEVNKLLKVHPYRKGGVIDAVEEMEKGGLDVPVSSDGKLSYPLKEIDGDRLTLATRILYMINDDIKVRSDIQCPRCGSSMVADKPDWADLFCLQCGERFRRTALGREENNHE